MNEKELWNEGAKAYMGVNAQKITRLMRLMMQNISLLGSMGTEWRSSIGKMINIHENRQKCNAEHTGNGTTLN